MDSRDRICVVDGSQGGKKGGETVKALVAIILAEIGLGLLPLVLPALVVVLLVAYLLAKPLYWLALGWGVYKVGSLFVAWRERITKQRLDEKDPPPVDKSHGRNTEDWTEWFGIG